MVSKRNLLFQGLLFGFHKFLGHMEECYWVLYLLGKRLLQMCVSTANFSLVAHAMLNKVSRLVFFCARKNHLEYLF